MNGYEGCYFKRCCFSLCWYTSVYQWLKLAAGTSGQPSNLGLVESYHCCSLRLIRVVSYILLVPGAGNLFIASLYFKLALIICTYI